MYDLEKDCYFLTSFNWHWFEKQRTSLIKGYIQMLPEIGEN